MNDTVSVGGVNKQVRAAVLSFLDGNGNPVAVSAANPLPLSGGGGGGGSQTPWTSDINSAGYRITDTNTIVSIDPTLRFLYDQFSEKSVNWASDSQGDTNSTLKIDPDYGWVTVQNAILYGDSGGAHVWSIDSGGNFITPGSVFIGGNGWAMSSPEGFVFNNGRTDSPQLIFYYGNNSNVGMFGYSNGSQNYFRFVRQTYESGGADFGGILSDGGMFGGGDISHSTWAIDGPTGSLTLSGTINVANTPIGDPHIVGQLYQDPATFAVFVSQG